MKAVRSRITTGQPEAGGGPLLLRPAFFDEGQELLAIMRRAIAVQCPTAYGAEAVQRWLAPQSPFQFRLPDHVFVAVLGEQLLGYSGWNLETEPDLARITACYVDPKTMEQGVGRRLLHHSVIDASLDGKARIYLNATQNARPFYAAQGFEVKGEFSFPIADNESLSGPIMWLKGTNALAVYDHFSIRHVHDGDAEGVIDLIKRCFDEYDGVFLDLENDDAILYKMRSGFRAKGGDAWVLEYQGNIIGSIGWAPGEKGSIELKKLYLAQAFRGRGFAETLVRLVLDISVRIKAEQVELWSDVKFTRAHAFYKKAGFEMTGETRALEDVSNTREIRFVMSGT